MFKLANARSSTLLLLLVVASSAFAAGDPSLQQVYDAARAGHLDDAQRMMDTVLRDHPDSGKAHYVQAELYAKQNRIQHAREALANAERLSPGLPFAKPEAVRALQEELSRPVGLPRERLTPQSPFSWGIALIVVLGVGGIWMLMRRRTVSASPYYSNTPTSTGLPVTGNAASMASPSAMPPAATGTGSGIASGLASGLAVGAGVVAGEALARNLFSSGTTSSTPSSEPPERPAAAAPDNSDMGGADFGVQDPGSGSWDDDTPDSGTSSDDDWN